MQTPAQRRARAKYEREKTKQYKIRLSTISDADMIAYLDSLNNRQGRLKELIRADMAHSQNPR